MVSWRKGSSGGPCRYQGLSRNVKANQGESRVVRLDIKAHQRKYGLEAFRARQAHSEFGESMSNVEVYLSALQGWKRVPAPHAYPPDRIKPVLLPGGCKLYRLPSGHPSPHLVTKAIGRAAHWVTP